MSMVEYTLVRLMAACGLKWSSKIECFEATVSPNTCPNIFEVVLKSSMCESWFRNITILIWSSIDARSVSKILLARC